jgi:hypothetical protein
MADTKKTTPAAGGHSGTAKREKAVTSKSIQQNATISKAFCKAVKDTEAEAGTVIDGIITIKVYYESGAILRHTVTVTKKYRERGQA